MDNSLLLLLSRIPRIFHQTSGNLSIISSYQRSINYIGKSKLQTPHIIKPSKNQILTRVHRNKIYLIITKRNCFMNLRKIVISRQTYLVSKLRIKYKNSTVRAARRVECCFGEVYDDFINYWLSVCCISIKVLF